jgi:hypothetical protein
MLQEIEKIRDFHFVKKCKLSNEGCRKLLSIGYGIRDGPDHRGKELNNEKQPSTHGMGV